MTRVTPEGPKFFCAPAKISPYLLTSICLENKFEEQSATSNFSLLYFSGFGKTKLTAPYFFASLAALSDQNTSKLTITTSLEEQNTFPNELFCIIDDL
ncbi:hypothetical protein BpHYR1_050320 [Brachionus plicatilis]|uniref:Uncharacterized protein n=1 Tax=Brachionus plicatilis TaxID=10195 RepID=A0A3M7SCM4_BRAPC|nr:hypothetical protein BpHYR1_050320 [Brachionus plicatilis]